MHRSEADDLARCLQCGAEVSRSQDRAYAFGEDSLLCMACALQRGGRYDDQRDKWTEPPRVEGLRIV
jgi:hypothetical protein